jgi:preprotein translocase subunit SecA
VTPPPPVADPAPATAPAASTGSGLPEDFGRPERPAQVEYSGPTFDSAPGSTGVERTSGPASSALAGQGAKPGSSAGTQSRNQPCACGSGRKYKRCHGDPRHS